VLVGSPALTVSERQWLARRVLALGIADGHEPDALAERNERSRKEDPAATSLNDPASQELVGAGHVRPFKIEPGRGANVPGPNQAMADPVEIVGRCEVHEGIRKLEPVMWCFISVRVKVQCFAPVELRSSLQ